MQSTLRTLCGARTQAVLSNTASLFQGQDRVTFTSPADYNPGRQRVTSRVQSWAAGPEQVLEENPNLSTHPALAHPLSPWISLILSIKLLRQTDSGGNRGDPSLYKVLLITPTQEILVAGKEPTIQLLK